MAKAFRRCIQDSAARVLTTGFGERIIYSKEYSMNRLSCAALTASVVALAGLPAFAQSVISAHSGLIHYVEGRVLLDGKPVEVKITAFPEIKEGKEFRTEDGRAEVLLNPGVFLRMGENSGLRMVSNKLSDTQVEFLSGSIIIESSGDLAQKEDSVSVLYKGSSVHLRKKGIYRFDSDPAQLRVASGEAELKTGSNVLIVKSGKMVAFDGAVTVEKFNAKEGDALSRWSLRRAEGIALANLSAAKYVKDSGRTWSSNGWYYNPYYGMFTFIPGGHGMFSSAYGYRYYSPEAAYHFFYQPVVSYVDHSAGYGGGYNSNLGYNTASQTSSGYSGVMASAPAATSAGTSTGAASSGGGSVSQSGSGGGRSR